MSQPPPQPPFNGAPPPSFAPSAPPPAGGMPPFPPPGFLPAPGAPPPQFPGGAPPAQPTQPVAAFGIPVGKQPLNTQPSRTVYVSNLNEKVKLDVLKNSLRTLFKQYGVVLDVVAHQNIRMRGQAFVAYPDEESAAKAIKELQHFCFTTSQWFSNLLTDGDFESHKKQRLAKKEEVSKLPLPGSHKPTFKASRPQTSSSHFNPTANIPDEYLPPNNILFLQKLPETITQQQLIELFQRYPGFREVRMIPTKKSIAFVEYDNELQSAVARAELSGHSFGPGQDMKVTFARK
ncbi:unnamed protein product [Mucor hiemalis]